MGRCRKKPHREVIGRRGTRRKGYVVRGEAVAKLWSGDELDFGHRAGKAFRLAGKKRMERELAEYCGECLP